MQNRVHTWGLCSWPALVSRCYSRRNVGVEEESNRVGFCFLEKEPDWLCSPLLTKEDPRCTVRTWCHECPAAEGKQASDGEAALWCV